MFAIAVCVLLISVNGTELIMYNSIVARFEWAAAVVLPCPLVILEMVEPEIVPDIISLSILMWTVPLDGKLVLDVNVTEVPDAVIAPFNVVDIPDDTPVIVTLFDVLYIPWSAWFTLTTVEPFVNTIGLVFSLCP